MRRIVKQVTMLVPQNFCKIGPFYGTGIPAAVLIFNKPKRKGRAKQILFIHAA